MIDLNGFSDLVPQRGGRQGMTYITLFGDRGHIVLSNKAYQEVTRFFGSTVSIKVSPDLGTFVLMRGGDRRIGSTNRDVSIKPVKGRLAEKFGESIATLFCDTRWDEGSKGEKLFVVELNGKKEYRQDATVRRLVDGRA